MGVRHSVEMTLQVGPGASLTPPLFSGEVSQLLDALERVESGTYTLDAQEQNVQVDFGDVAQARIVWIDADGELEVSFGGSVGHVASVQAGTGTFPTSFAGGETFSFTIDGVALTGTFTSGDQTVQQCINRLNAAAMLAGFAYVPFTLSAGKIKVSGSDASAAGSVVVSSGTANAALGFSTTTVNGTDPTPGSAPMQLRRPISPDASTSTDVMVFALLSVSTGSLTLKNLESAQKTTVHVALVGDVVSA